MQSLVHLFRLVLSAENIDLGHDGSVAFAELRLDVVDGLERLVVLVLVQVQVCKSVIEFAPFGKVFQQ